MWLPLCLFYVCVGLVSRPFLTLSCLRILISSYFHLCGDGLCIDLRCWINGGSGQKVNVSSRAYLSFLALGR